MKLLYTHENKIIVENARNCVREAGIESILKNEYSAGGIGELSPLETWPELWVHEENFDKAKEIVEQLTSKVSGENWECSKCNEENESTFEVCWNCQSSRL